MKFISQKGQDDWIIRDVFNYKKHGYFVDLAASNGLIINNTFLLETQLNWNGICIEPNPTFHRKLKQNRNCHISTHAIDNENDKVVKFRVDNAELGGIVDDDTDNNYTIRGEEMERTGQFINIKTKTLESILDQYNSPKVIDYLSLDVEGSETRILKNFPFNKYTFLAMTIERPTIELENILFDNDYVFVMKSKRMAMDSYYIHKSLPNFDKIIKEPYSPTPKKDW